MDLCRKNIKQLKMSYLFKLNSAFLILLLGKQMKFKQNKGQIDNRPPLFKRMVSSSEYNFVYDQKNIQQLIKKQENIFKTMLRNEDSIIVFQRTQSKGETDPLRRLSYETHFQQYCVKKSIFDPISSQLSSYSDRKHLSGVQIPQIDIIQMHDNWLLLTSPKYNHAFFKKLNRGSLGNIYEQLINIFNSFVVLTKKYGFFCPTQNMIFMQKHKVKVWINQDIFKNQPMIPLGRGKYAQKQFVMGFLKMVENNLKESESFSNLESQYLINNQLQGCKSVPFIQSSSQINPKTTELSNSFMKRRGSIYKMQKSSGNNALNGLVSKSKVLKTSIYETKYLQQGNQIRRTKKKFNATSTSSTLQKFSLKQRTTLGSKKSSKSPQARNFSKSPEAKPQQKQIQTVSKSKEPQHQKSIFIEPLNILNELEELFEDDVKKSIQFAVQPTGDQLQRIAQEMQEILTW